MNSTRSDALREREGEKKREGGRERERESDRLSAGREGGIHEEGLWIACVLKH